ncbi:sugar transporter [Pseudosulfitobacter sp. SM2401]|uniref:sugar transporter n=1 Tax=Pseudosulfitobacter sp. SM2401 TaxID=3350098 RepID=UPI0036F407CB
MTDNEKSEAELKATFREGTTGANRGGKPRKFLGSRPEAAEERAQLSEVAPVSEPQAEPARAPQPETKAEATPAALDDPKPKADAPQKPAAKPDQKQAPNPGTKKPKADPKPKVVEVVPMAPRARMRRRHYGLVLSFLLIVVAPLIVTAWYLWAVSTDQYASTAGFTVRQEEGGAASTGLLGNASALLGGGSTQSDTDILYEFIQSQEMIKRIDERYDLRAHYSEPWPDDIVFSLHPDASIEDMQQFWGRIVRVSYDQSSGLLELRVLAFDAQMAQQISRGILVESQAMINALNEQARTDAIGYADDDLDVALARLKNAREALILFRTRTQIVDPETDLQGRLGVVNNLQQQLAEALVGLDVLLDQSSESDPRIKQARRTIEVIRNRIAIERQNVASGDASVADGDDYPTLLAEYEGLIVDREFSEEGYRAALASLDLARTNAQRQSRYLAAYVQPTLPETAEFPRRMIVLGLIGLFVLLIWSILTLIYYSIRDSR